MCNNNVAPKGNMVEIIVNGEVDGKSVTHLLWADSLDLACDALTNQYPGIYCVNVDYKVRAIGYDAPTEWPAPIAALCDVCDDECYCDFGDGDRGEPELCLICFEHYQRGEPLMCCKASVEEEAYEHNADYDEAFFLGQPDWNNVPTSPEALQRFEEYEVAATAIIKALNAK